MKMTTNGNININNSISYFPFIRFHFLRFWGDESKLSTKFHSIVFIFRPPPPPPPHTHLPLGCECPYLVYYGFFGVHLLKFCIEVLVGVCTPLIIGSVSGKENGQTDGRGTISCLGLLKIKISHSS